MMKVYFVSLGCDKNKVDSEKLLKFFITRASRNDGMVLVDSPIDADVAIVNTCGFINDAKKESKAYIDYFIKLKKQNRLKKILVCGCYVKELLDNEAKDVKKYVDVILPLDSYRDFTEHSVDRVCDILSFASNLKISDGCDKFCSYCIIPYLRGRYRSISKEVLLDEAKKLAMSGTKELSIIGQDVLSYGRDIYGKQNIVELVNEISRIKGIEWIRLLYCYPEEIENVNIIDLFKKNKKVLHYIDMPIQHSSDKILKLMNRKTNKESIIRIVKKLREAVPDIVIRTTIMVGFPGETDENFEELLDFVKEMKFDKLGCFAYSREKLSRSYDFENQVDEKTKERRKKIILETQKKIAIEKNSKYLGKIYRCIVEGYDTKTKKYVVRPYFDAREIDDVVYVDAKKKLLSGTFIYVRCDKIIGMDFIGGVV